MSIFLKHRSKPHRRFCFLVEAKLDGFWYWTACACGHANVSVGGNAECRVDAMIAAEEAVDELNRCLCFYEHHGTACPDDGSCTES